MKKEFVIQRQGRDFVLYAGLLDLAHDQGLQSLVTEVVTATATLAMFKATATFKDGRVFVCHGDATPDNVGRNIAPHFYRMGETRAKARALRDALNIGAVSLEELGEDDQAPQYLSGRQANEQILARQAEARAMNPPTPAAAHPSAKPGRAPDLLDAWSRAEAAQEALRGIGTKPPALPPDDADEVELASYVDDCRTVYREKKAKAVAR